MLYNHSVYVFFVSIRITLIVDTSNSFVYETILTAIIILQMPTIPIAQHITHFNSDEFSLDGNLSPINSEFDTRNTRRSSESEDDMNTGINSEPENGSTRPSTPHTLPPGSTTGSIHSGLQLAHLPNSQTIISSPFLQRPLNGTPTLQQIQIPAHLLGNGQIMHTHSEVGCVGLMLHCVRIYCYQVNLT